MSLSAEVVAGVVLGLCVVGTVPLLLSMAAVASVVVVVVVAVVVVVPVGTTSTSMVMITSKAPSIGLIRCASVGQSLTRWLCLSSAYGPPMLSFDLCED